MGGEALMKYDGVKLVMARVGRVKQDATFRPTKKAPLPTGSFMIDITEKSSSCNWISRGGCGLLYNPGIDWLNC
jgi:hypothetical protein